MRTAAAKITSLRSELEQLGVSTYSTESTEPPATVAKAAGLSGALEELAELTARGGLVAGVGSGGREGVSSQHQLKQQGQTQQQPQQQELRKVCERECGCVVVRIWVGGCLGVGGGGWDDGAEEWCLCVCVCVCVV